MAEVPKGLKEGDTFQVQTEDGQFKTLTVPKGATEGSKIPFEYTPRGSTAAAPAGHVKSEAEVAKLPYCDYELNASNKCSGYYGD